MIRRIYVEKRPGFDVEARHLLDDLRGNLGIAGLQKLRLINRYDVDGLDDAAFAAAREGVFSEPNVDRVYDGHMDLEGWRCFATEYLPGQYDQRADSAEQCVRLLIPGSNPVVKAARLIALSGELSDEDMQAIQGYSINPIDSRLADMRLPETLDLPVGRPEDVAVLDGFTQLDEAGLAALIKEYGLAMDLANLSFCRDYFAGEKRDPSITELRILDTYWSDHCRHTTFLTELQRLDIEQGPYSPAMERALERYMQARKQLYGDRDKPVTLMDMATIGAKLIKAAGKLDDLDESEEINACSVKIKVDVDGAEQDWLLQFKNETHNHPTEIEPFGGAATCLGGAIRDILSGRAYAHQSMRITGSGNPLTPYADTLPGKLPQRKITTGAAAGFSSYGNQIGLATGYVHEIYDEGYVAKRMELGAVVGACPAENVLRQKPMPGDVVILLGGRTGRDGIGGATGSSKEHDASSLDECGSEVQKGNAITERKIQRLFRDPHLSRMIKRCNDFGAGGVSVAIGELAEGLDIDLDRVPKKYEGLDGTELAISESQERMAVVVDKADAEEFIRLADGENLEATVVAKVTGNRRLRLSWRGKAIADISRDFLDTNGVTGRTEALVKAVEGSCYLDEVPAELAGKELREAWEANLRRLNVCAQTGLVQRFDSNIGGASVLMPLGGKRQLSPEEGMVAKIPVLAGETNTVSAMAYGYMPRLATWSPFHAGMYSVAESLSRMAAMGMDALKSRLSFQEYFEKMTEPQRWGKPAAALLGALEAQCGLDVPSIGGKDSMSGTFEGLNVPPTIISFAVNSGKADRMVSAAIAEAGLKVYLCRLPHDPQSRVPDWQAFADRLRDIHALAGAGALAAASVIREGGLAAALTRMCVGNDMGLDISAKLGEAELFAPDCGSILLCLRGDIPANKDKYQYLGETSDSGQICINGISMDIHGLREQWVQPLESVFPTRTDVQPKGLSNAQAPAEAEPWEYRRITHASVSFGKPRVVIPVFPGTNSEYDSARAFERAGGVADIVVINNLSQQGIEDSIERLATALDNSQILMLPGGFSSGDEPDGSGKFIATFLRNPRVAEAVNGLYKRREGLILGICNGFQALVKTGLLPYGELGELSPEAPTLTFNSLGRHVACMAYTRIQSVLSPWAMFNQPGDVYAVPVSHGEGRFTASAADLDKLFAAGQVVSQYAGLDGRAELSLPWNPNGSDCAIEGICSPDGRILGKMGHNERAGGQVPSNIPGNTDSRLFEAGVCYFK